jgi:hypothetical protein
VRGIETLTTYDPQTEEFIINTPCESAQKYWIGGAAKVHKPFCFLSKSASSLIAFHLLLIVTQSFRWKFLMDDKCIVTLSDFYVLDLVKHKKQEANCSLCHLQHATHTVVFSQLSINGRNEGVHAFICQLRDAEGHVCPGIRIADCGHKIGLNGVDNGRIW